MNTGTTRQHKASIFLDVVKSKGKCGMKHFIDALQFEVPELYTKITGKEPTVQGEIHLFKVCGIRVSEVQCKF